MKKQLDVRKTTYSCPVTGTVQSHTTYFRVEIASTDYVLIFVIHKNVSKSIFTLERGSQNKRSISSNVHPTPITIGHVVFLRNSFRPGTYFMNDATFCR